MQGAAYINKSSICAYISQKKIMKAINASNHWLELKETTSP